MNKNNIKKIGLILKRIQMSINPASSCIFSSSEQKAHYQLKALFGLFLTKRLTVTFQM